MKQEPVMFTMMVWRVTADSVPENYTVLRPPLEMYVKECSNLAELKRESQIASDRWTGKENTIVTSGFAIQYGSEKDEPKFRGLKQWWASGPIMSKKGA